MLEETVSGRTVCLNLLNENHRSSTWQALGPGSDESDFQYMAYKPFKYESDFDLWFDNCLNDQTSRVFSISTREASKTLGVLSLMSESVEHKVVEVGSIHYSNRLQQTVEGTEAIYLAMKHVFHDLKYRRLEWKCDNMNERSKKAALRYGFKFEGVFRQHRIIKERNRDTAWFSIIDSEWPALKNEFERWLCPANFNSMVVQLTPLQNR